MLTREAMEEREGRALSAFAMRSADGKFLGTIEVSQDLTAKRALEGQQRLVNYVGGKTEK